MPSVVCALATGERLTDNTLSFCDVKCQNITAWTWRVLELSVAVNSGAGEALAEAWGTCSALMESIRHDPLCSAEMPCCWGWLCCWETGLAVLGAGGCSTR